MIQWDEKLGGPIKFSGGLEFKSNMHFFPAVNNFLFFWFFGQGIRTNRTSDSEMESTNFPNFVSLLIQKGKLPSVEESY